MSQSLHAKKFVQASGLAQLAGGFALIVGVGFSNLAYAGGDATAGQSKSTTCAACHGADGNSAIPTNPVLAGQYESYIVQALTSYRSGTRKNAIMAGFASQLSDTDIADLAAYFSSQAGPLQTAK